MTWGAWLGATTVVVLGLAVLGEIAPSTVGPALLLILLSIAVTRPGFTAEFAAIMKRFY